MTTEDSLLKKKDKCTWIQNIIIYGVCIAIVGSVIVVSTFPRRKVSYQGVTAVQVANVTKEDVVYLLEISSELHVIEAFEISGKFDLLMNKKNLPDLEDRLFEKNLKYRVVVEDYQSLIDQEEEEIQRRKAEFKSEDFDTGNHHTYEEISSYLQMLSKTNEMVSVEIIGRSAERRDILLARVSAGSSNRPIVFLNCNIHAREWASTTTCLWILNHLSMKHNEDPEVKNMLDSYDWYIVPVSNPDGYVYTWTVDRLWRKNRTPIEGSDCVGVDLDRNFGASDNRSTERLAAGPCNPRFQGSFPFSEPESRATRGALEKYRERIKMALFLHSYGHGNEKLPAKSKQTEIKANMSANGLFTNQMRGGSDTAVKHVFEIAKINHSYIIELPKKAQNAFIVPVESIVRMARETWNGTIAAARALLDE